MKFRFLLQCSAFLALLHTLSPDAGATEPAGAFVRVTLLSPEARPWRVQVVAQSPGGKAVTIFAGKANAQSAQAAGMLKDGQATGWIDVSQAVSEEGTTVRFLFETDPPLEAAGIKASVDVAASADASSILRSMTDHDPGNVIAIRIPQDPRSEKSRILSIREDTQRRLDELKALHLPEGPRPRKIWCMSGFRSNGEFYSDPEIARMDFQIFHLLGMNGMYQQVGGQPGALRQMAQAEGIDRSTVFWRAVESLPGDKDLGGAARLNWPNLETFLEGAYRDAVAGAHKEHPDGMPYVIADLMDEPAGFNFNGPEYQREFRTYVQRNGLTPQVFGKGKWEEVVPVLLDWRTYFARRAALDMRDENARRLWYWSAKFWNYATARVYATATREVERFSPATGTRINPGPPWVYDYGTLPRGIDAFEFGRLRSVTLGFNEDWVGMGSPRVPLEIDTLLMDWSRAAARPNTPLLGCYITRDADRAGVKLRTFACLAREAKIFDFYYYGPAYTFFDHWSDNALMVQGVAELTRDIGAVDDVLWEGRAPRANVALLYSSSWPVWKEDDTEQCEQMMVYVALLHAGIPVDIVSDAEVADGRFAARGYKALYVVNESIPGSAAAEIARWVQGGGKLWASGWAGMKDEYNSPTEAWNDLLGVKSRSWKPAGDLKRFGEPLRPDDWLRPIVGREVRLDLTDALTSAPAGRRPIRHAFGSGLVQIVPWTAGKNYMDGAIEKRGSLAKTTLFPHDDRRTLFSEFALAAGDEPPATTSADQVLAWPLWTQREGLILLANYTGEPSKDLRVSFTSAIPITSVRSLRHGELPIVRVDSNHIQVTIPTIDVTDILQLK